MNAIISGSSGHAIAVDRNTLFFMDIEESVWKPISPDQLPGLLSGLADARVFEGLSLEQISAELKAASDLDDTLSLFLISVDRAADPEVRSKALGELEQFISNPKLCERLENILCALPVHPSGDLDSAIRLSPSETRSREFLIALNRLQPVISQVAKAWEEVPLRLFEGVDDKAWFRRELIFAGGFRRLSRQCEAAGSTDNLLRDILANRRLSRSPNSESILNFWLSRRTRVSSPRALSDDKKGTSKAEEMDSVAAGDSPAQRDESLRANRGSWAVARVVEIARAIQAPPHPHLPNMRDRQGLSPWDNWLASISALRAGWGSEEFNLAPLGTIVIVDGSLEIVEQLALQRHRHECLVAQSDRGDLIAVLDASSAMKLVETSTPIMLYLEGSREIRENLAYARDQREPAMRQTRSDGLIAVRKESTSSAFGWPSPRTCLIIALSVIQSLAKADPEVELLTPTLGYCGWFEPLWRHHPPSLRTLTDLGKYEEIAKYLRASGFNCGVFTSYSEAVKRYEALKDWSPSGRIVAPSAYSGGARDFFGVPCAERISTDPEQTRDVQ